MTISELAFIQGRKIYTARSSYNTTLPDYIERGARQVWRPSFTVETPMLSLVTALVSIGNILRYRRHMH